MNICITAWIIELLGSFVGIVVFFSPQEYRTTMALQILCGIIYNIAVPSTYLINSKDVKKRILDNRIYLSFTNRFFPHVNQILPMNIEIEKNEAK